MEERRDSSDDMLAGAGMVVASSDVDEEDRRARRSLVIACLLALLLAAAAGFANADSSPDSTSTNGTNEPSAGGAAPSEACPVSEEVAAALSAAATPWDYMLILGYPKHSIGDVLNQRAESVMEEHANGQVRWDPAANDGIYPDDAQLVLIVGVDGATQEISNTHDVMGLLGMEAVCTSGPVDVVLPVLS